jgi:hypothetical protein
MLYTDAHNAATRAYKASYEINGPCEETTELEENAYLLSQRLSRRLGLEEDDEDDVYKGPL